VDEEGKELMELNVESETEEWDEEIELESEASL